MIQFTCPGCGDAMSAADQHAGKTGTCMNCRDKVRIPWSTFPVVQTPEPVDAFALPQFDDLPSVGRTSSVKNRGPGILGIIASALVPTVVCAAGLMLWGGRELPRFAIVVQPQPKNVAARTLDRPRFTLAQPAPLESPSRTVYRGISAAVKSSQPRENVSEQPTISESHCEIEDDEPIAAADVESASTEDGPASVTGMESDAKDTPETPSRDKPKAKGKTKSSPAKTLVESEAPKWSTLDFGWVSGDESDGNLSAVDKDQTLEGKSRLAELESTARGLYRDYHALQKELSPSMARRAPLIHSVNLATQQNQQAIPQVEQLQAQADVLKGQLQLTSGSVRRDLQNNLNQINGQIGSMTRQINGNIAGINQTMPQIQSLNYLIQPLNEQLTKLGSQMTETRKQWLTIRQPIEKYTRGDFELLRNVLDDWLLIDGLWPDAQLCGALCAYETGDMEGAYGYLEKLIDLETNIYKPKKPWARTEALKGLVLMKMPGQTTKAKTAMQRAAQLVDKKTDWETYFILGRSCADRDREAAKAKIHLENALKIKPNFPLAKLWLARVQTSATSDKIHDPQSAVKTLESLWKSSGERSWRMADWLSQAYRAAGETDAAARTMTVAVSLAPPEFQGQLREKPE